MNTGIADAINPCPMASREIGERLPRPSRTTSAARSSRNTSTTRPSTTGCRRLLDEIIAARHAKAIEYEEYLKRIGELAKRVEAGQAEDTPEQVDTPERRALYNNLNKDRDLALKIDDAVRQTRPDGWRGVQSREMVIKRALYDVLQDVAEVERIFLIVKAQREY